MAAPTPGSRPAVLCPHCGERPVEATARSYQVRGRGWAHRVRGRPVVGCTRCVRRELLRGARRSAVHGWSGITGSLVNPFLVLHDLARAVTVRKDPEAVAKGLRGLGMGEGGRADILDVAYALAASVIHADGEREAGELDVALEAGRRLLPGFDARRFRDVWERHRDLPAPEDLAPLLGPVLSRDEKEAVLDFLLEIARADRRVDDVEDALLRRVAVGLGVDVREWRVRSLGRIAERSGFGRVEASRDS